MKGLKAGPAGQARASFNASSASLTCPLLLKSSAAASPLISICTAGAVSDNSFHMKKQKTRSWGSIELLRLPRHASVRACMQSVSGTHHAPPLVANT